MNRAMGEQTSAETFTSAYVYGGSTYIAHPEELATLATQLACHADQLLDCAHAYAQCQAYVDTQSAVISTCVAPSHAEAASPFPSRLYSFAHCCERQQEFLISYANALRVCSDKIIRSLGLYSHAEAQTAHILGFLMHCAVGFAPVPLTAALGVWSAAQEFTSSRGSVQGLLTNNYDTQQNYLHSVADLVSQGRGIPGAAEQLSPAARFVRHVYQAEKLSVTSITVSHPLPSARTMQDSLSHLDQLSTGQTGNSYGTVSIQRYTHADNTHSWIVTIPGTDGKKDSPFGWAQNVSLMSEQATTRASAESQQVVLEAMRQAGIQPDDHVALVGHSQGGIIAASIASDRTVPYTISHVVTAGSPIAHHPIPSSTWVTSIETDHELVSNLDGSHNPAHRHWVTIQGKIEDTPSTHTSTRVPYTSEKHELSHGMNYHVATYSNALKLNNDGLHEHNDHFAKLTDGTLDKNLYFECRIHE